ncbi:MAG: M20/M25/M40 family metallo-hydrolase [Bdellovibrionota bacterium]
MNNKARGLGFDPSIRVFFLLVTVLSFVPATHSSGSETRPLSYFARHLRDLTAIPANSEQTHPLYLGLTPLEMQLGKPSKKTIQLPHGATELAQRQAKFIRDALAENQTELALKTIEFELWPSRNEHGVLTWVFARWREKRADSWIWLEEKKLTTKIADAQLDPPPILPELLEPWIAEDRNRIFQDFLERKSLYEKPEFSNGIWIDAASSKVLSAWPDPSEAKAYLEASASPSRMHFRTLPQPARADRDPFTFHLSVSPLKFTWSRAIAETPFLSNFSAMEKEPAVQKWPEQFENDYKEDVTVLSGEKEATFPLSRQRVSFKRKNSASPNHQLEKMVDYLQERYKTLKIPTHRHRFYWRGIPQSNLLAVIEGSLPLEENRPVLIADHIDTAFAEDAFQTFGARVAVPGADDNVTAVAALLAAAKTLKNSKPRHDIWLLHLTGEEFPADCLGARMFVEKMLKHKQQISGLVLLDMIGYNKPGNRLFQLNLGKPQGSSFIGRIALDAAEDLGISYNPVVRPYGDPKNYLYNTDGIIFSDAGYPVVLFNEHLNLLENLDRRHYHETTDTIEHIDWDYTIAIVKTAIETVARIAQ